MAEQALNSAAGGKPPAASISDPHWRERHDRPLYAVELWPNQSLTRSGLNIVLWIAGIGSLLAVGLIMMRIQRQEDPDETGSSRADNLAILEEMRQRLEDLSIPESTPQPQISVAPNAMLPRRSPISETPPGIAPAPAEAPTPPAPAEADLFANGAPWADDGADLFEDLTDDPFEVLGISPTEEAAGFPAVPPPADKLNVFATAVEVDPPADFLSNPFGHPLPSVSVISAPEPPRPEVNGPPPLPDAVDPLTGEPDEAAYTEWLKEWLCYAEQYGDDAPGDPSRV